LKAIFIRDFKSTAGEVFVCPAMLHSLRAALQPQHHCRVAGLQRRRASSRAHRRAMCRPREVWTRWRHVPADLCHLRLLRASRWACGGRG